MTRPRPPGQAREILKVIPRQPLAQFLLGLAYSANRQGDEADHGVAPGRGAEA